MADNPVPQPAPQFDASPQPLAVGYARRRIVMYHVAETELDALVSGGTSLNWLFFGICFGALASFSSVLLSTPIASAKTFATFVALTVVFLIGSVVFGINGWRDYRQVKQRLTSVKAASPQS
jgi:uncharacterized membrane protein (DUF485 family)